MGGVEQSFELADAILVLGHQLQSGSGGRSGPQVGQVGRLCVVESILHELQGQCGPLLDVLLACLQQHIQATVVCDEVGAGCVDQRGHFLAALVDAAQGEGGGVVDGQRVPGIAVPVVELDQLALALSPLGLRGDLQRLVAPGEVRLDLDAGQQQVQHRLYLRPHHVAVLLHGHLVHHHQLVLLLDDVLHRYALGRVHTLAETVREHITHLHACQCVIIIDGVQCVHIRRDVRVARCQGLLHDTVQLLHPLCDELWPRRSPEQVHLTDSVQYLSIKPLEDRRLREIVVAEVFPERRNQTCALRLILAPQLLALRLPILPDHCHALRLGESEVLVHFLAVVLDQRQEHLLHLRPAPLQRLHPGLHFLPVRCAHWLNGPELLQTSLLDLRHDVQAGVPRSVQHNSDIPHSRAFELCLLLSCHTKLSGFAHCFLDSQYEARIGILLHRSIAGASGGDLVQHLRGVISQELQVSLVCIAVHSQPVGHLDREVAVDLVLGGRELLFLEDQPALQVS